MKAKGKAVQLKEGADALVQRKRSANDILAPSMTAC